MKKASIALSAMIALGFGTIGEIKTAGAANFSPMNMMSPNRWMGNNNNYRNDYYDGPRYNAPPAGYYGAPGYGGQPGYGAPNQVYQAPQQNFGGTSAPAATDSAADQKIRQLEERIRQLESQKQFAPQQGTAGYQQQQGAGGYQQQQGAGGYQQQQGAGGYQQQQGASGYQPSQEPVFRPN